MLHASLLACRYAQAELVHSRFAMLAVAGILVPELLSNIGLSWPGAGVAWYDAGKFEYFAPTNSLFGVQMLLFAWVELRRYVPSINVHLLSAVVI